MRVFIGCEYSGVVRDAFAALGHTAVSCDILPTESDGNHIQGDVMEALKVSRRWDLIILHPPCTAMCLSGNRWYGKDKPRHNERLGAIEWTKELWELAKTKGDRVVLENPTGVIWKYIGKPQYIQPWMFGHGETKRTGLLLHNVPELQPTNIVEGREQRIWKLPPSEDRGKIRSRTYEGIGRAMAEQWGVL